MPAKPLAIQVLPDGSPVPVGKVGIREPARDGWPARLMILGHPNDLLALIERYHWTSEDVITLEWRT